MDVSTIIWLIIIIITLTLPIIMVKKYLQTSNVCYIIITIVLYTILTFGYVYILKVYPIYYLYVPWFISMALVLFAGVLLFNEKMKPINVAGVIMGLVSMYLVVK